MNGALEFYKACRKHDVKPILGFEAYLVDDVKDDAVRFERNHLTLLAEKPDGVPEPGQAVVRRVPRRAATRQAQRRPATARAVLRRRDRADRLPGVALLPPAGRRQPGGGARARRRPDPDLRARDVYFELQVNGIPEQDKANEGIARIAREVGRPVVGTADVHYLTRDDHANHSALLCVQTKSTLAEPKLTFDTNEFYLKGSQEMAEAFAPWPEAIPMTREIADRCDVHIETGNQLIPSYPTPDGADEEAYLRALAHAGLRERYGDPPPARTPSSGWRWSSASSSRWASRRTS